MNAKLTHAPLGFLCLSIFLVSCTPRQMGETLATQTINTAVIFGKQQSVQESFLATSTFIFYPDGFPQDVTVLPTLPSESIEIIQSELDIQASLLLSALDNEKQLIQSIFAPALFVPDGQAFFVQQFDQPSIHLNQIGDIIIDVRVLQSIYRGVLISTSAEKLPRCEPPYSIDCQRYALQIAFDARDAFLRRSPIPAVAQARSLSQLLDSGLSQLFDSSRPNLEEIAAAFDLHLRHSLSLLDAERTALSASRRFDDAILFVLAHEIAHRVLNHWGRWNAGEDLFLLENEADRFAAVLSILTRNRSVQPRAPSFVMIDGQLYEKTRYGDCAIDYNHKSTGHHDFFDFGYELAGFIDGDENYPDRNSRMEHTRAVTTAALMAIDIVQNQKGRCGGQMPSVSTDQYLADLQRRWEEEYLRWKSWAEDAKSRSNRAFLLEGAMIRGDLIKEKAIFDAFYREFLKKMSGRVTR